LRNILLSLRERMSGGQVREKGVRKEENSHKNSWSIIERLLPHPRRGGATFSLMEKGI
jgi:hypothetical protein